MPKQDKSTQILDVLRFRHACKRFDASRTVSDEDFRVLLEAARLSPTSFGFEPWKVVVLRDPVIREKLYPLAWGAQKSLEGASHFVILLARKATDMRYDAEFVAHMMRDIQLLPPETEHQRREKYRSFQADDFALLESDRAMFDWSGKQTYIVLANMLIAAAFLGIDSCPIEGFHRRQGRRAISAGGRVRPRAFRRLGHGGVWLSRRGAAPHENAPAAGRPDPLEITLISILRKKRAACGLSFVFAVFVDRISQRTACRGPLRCCSRCAPNSPDTNRRRRARCG